MKFDKKMQALCGLQGIFDLFNCKTPELIDKITTYDEYLENDEMARKRQTYSVQTEEDD